MQGIAYATAATLYRVQIDPALVQVVFACLDGGTAEVFLESVGGQPPTIKQPIVSGSSITWPEVSPGVDIRVTASADSLKILKILKTPAAANSFVWRIRCDPVGLANLNVAAASVSWDNDGNIDPARSAEALPRNVRRELQVQSDTGPVARLEDGRSEWRATETFSGQTYYVDPVTRIKQLRPAAETVYPAIIDPTINVGVSANADNGNEHSATWFATGELSSGYYGAAWQPYYGRNVGMRFLNVTVPQGSTVSSATIATQVRSVSGTTIAAGCAIWGDKVTDAAAWSNSSLPSGITKTTASTALPTTLPGVGAISWDVTTIVQELVNQGGWISGKSQRFAWLGPTGGTQGRAFYGTKGNHYADVPVLSVTYTAAASGGTIPRRRAGPGGLRPGPGRKRRARVPGSGLSAAPVVRGHRARSGPPRAVLPPARARRRRLPTQALALVKQLRRAVRSAKGPPPFAARARCKRPPTPCAAPHRRARPTRTAPPFTARPRVRRQMLAPAALAAAVQLRRRARGAQLRPFTGRGRRRVAWHKSPPPSTVSVWFYRQYVLSRKG